MLLLGRDAAPLAASVSGRQQGQQPCAVSRLTPRHARQAAAGGQGGATGGPTRPVGPAPFLRRNVRATALLQYQHANVLEQAPEVEALLPMPRAVESPADNPELANPLERQNRLSTGWFGIIMEMEGVVTESSQETHQQAWLAVADEFGYKRPLGQTLRRIKGVKDEAVVTRIFGWTHNPAVARQVAQRKAELYAQLLGGRQPAAMLEARPFLETLKRYSIPVALATPLKEAKVQEGLKRHSLTPLFDTVVTAEDSGSAEVEFYYAYAAQRIQRPPIRCVVVGDSNSSVEAAHELGMKCVVVTGNQPVYDFVGADLVVRNLSQLSFMNIKRLFASEELVESRTAPEELRGGGPGASSSSRDDTGMESSVFDNDDDFLDDEDDEDEDGGVGGRYSAGAGFARQPQQSRMLRW